MATSSPAGLVLVASGDEYSARSLESVLEPAGYRVLRVATGAGALERAASARPDLVLLATDLPDLDGVSVSRELRQDPSITPDLPVIGMTAAPVTRGQRLAWLRAGAWDCLAFPVDAEELLLKIDRYAGAKRHADRAWESALVDSATGLYNGSGLKRRARELVAAAVRAHAALACVVFGADRRPSERGAAVGAGAGRAAVRDRLGAVLRTHARESDTIGWWSEVEFAVLAPGTDDEGAAKLAERLAHAIETAPPEPGVSPPALDVCAGYVALTDVHETPVDPEDLLGRAGAALQLARAGVRGEGGGAARGARIRRSQGA